MICIGAVLCSLALWFFFYLSNDPANFSPTTGTGRPYSMDSPTSTTPGAVRRAPGRLQARPNGRSSPGNEMLTLDQFLKEVNASDKFDKPKRLPRSDDAEGNNDNNSAVMDEVKYLSFNHSNN